jgi:hypothetical protein
MDVLILTQVDDTAEIVVQPLEALELLKEFDETRWAEKVRVFGGDLDDDLKVLTEIGVQHLTKTDQTLFNAETAKEGDKPFGIQFVRPDNHAFDVGNILVVLESLFLSIITE